MQKSNDTTTKSTNSENEEIMELLGEDAKHLHRIGVFTGNFSVRKWPGLYFKYLQLILQL